MPPVAKRISTIFAMIFADAEENDRDTHIRSIVGAIVTVGVVLALIATFHTGTSLDHALLIVGP